MYTISQITSMIKNYFMKTNTKECAPYNTNPNTDDPMPDNSIKDFCLSYYNSTTGMNTVTIIYELINN